MTYKQRMAVLTAAEKQQEMANHFKRRGDDASAHKCLARAVDLRASLLR